VKIIRQSKLLYPLFQIIRLVLIDINHVDILQFFDEFSSGHIIAFLISNLPSLLDDVLLAVQFNNLWCFSIKW